MASQSFCRKKSCGNVVEGNVVKCPACGGSMAGASWIKTTGWVMAVVGALLLVPMVFVIMAFLPVVADPISAVAEGRFGGPADMVMPSFALLLIVLALGAMLLAFGLQRAIKGARNGAAKPLLLLTGLAFFAMFFYVGSTLPDDQMVDGIPVEDIR